MISPLSSIDHWIKISEIKQKIKAEFGFFDTEYFENVKKDESRKVGLLTIYFTGHGDDGMIIVGDAEGKG